MSAPDTRCAHIMPTGQPCGRSQLDAMHGTYDYPKPSQHPFVPAPSPAGEAPLLRRDPVSLHAGGPESVVSRDADALLTQGSGASSPPAIDIAAELRALRDAIHEWRDTAEDETATHADALGMMARSDAIEQRLLTEYTRQAAEIERLREDKARLDWLERFVGNLDEKAEVFLAGLGTTGTATAYQCEVAPCTPKGSAAWRSYQGASLRTAIDEARA